MKSKLFILIALLFLWSPHVLGADVPKPSSQETLNKLSAEGRKNEMTLEKNFPGKETTNFSDIENLSDVKNLTLSLNSYFTLRFTKNIDLTNKEIVSALEAISSDWKIERWSVEVPQTWWDRYKWSTPLIIGINHPTLTTYQAQLASFIDKNDTKPTFTLLSQTARGQEFIIDHPSFNLIQPNIQIESSENTINTNKTNIFLKGHSSHRDIVLFVVVNSAKTFDFFPIRGKLNNEGSFDIPIKDLHEGKNQVAIAFSRMLDKPLLVANMTVEYHPTLWERVIDQIKIKLGELQGKFIPPKKSEIIQPSSEQSDTTNQSMIPSEKSQLWLIAAGGILSTQNNEGFNDLVCTIPVSDIKSIILKDWWGIVDRKSALEVLEWLDKTGHRGDFDQSRKIIELYSQGDKTTYDELREKLMEMGFASRDSLPAFDFVFKHHIDLKNKSLIAWDFARMINISRWAYTSGYITKEEAWSYMMKAGKTIQKTYSSWLDFADNYLLGRIFWSRSENNPETRSSIMWLDKSPISPWKTSQWNETLK
jgi:hypothetical protein